MKDGKENSNATSGSFATNLDHTKPCWYWDKKDLAHTPSQSDGLDPATEARYRREGARFIFDVGTRLGLHYDTLATGITYFHRFYMFHSFKQFPRYVTGACCLFLAGKVEETPKKCKDIIKTARSLLNDVQFAQFGDDPKEEVMVLERILLQTIKFDLQVEHPYQFLLRYAKQLKGDKNKVQKLWEPEIIAVAVMYLAGRLCKFDIQEWTSKQSSRRWWEQFVQDVPVELLEDICHQILDLYSQGKQPIPQQPQIQDKEKPPPPPATQPGQSLLKTNLKPQQSKLGLRYHAWRVLCPLFLCPSPQIARLHLPFQRLLLKQNRLHQLKWTQHRDRLLLCRTGPRPPLPHRPPPPPPSNYIMGMSTSSSYMSGEGYQSLQSMMKTEAPSYAPMPPSFGLPYHPHVYPHPNPPPPGPPPPTSYPPPNLPPPTPSYPPPGYNPSYPPPPPRMPPGHNVPPPVMGMPPAGYPPPPVPPGQPQVPLPPHGMPPVAGMNRGGR
ncbi:Cyclin-K [Labeo rohita]|uniref:Cyclin-K n=1 Tax=Labeo rohita TaxID=84645 RepID=A0ABQ8LM43_LABRO|nr:Cyclin-K [Labeo rohita]